MAILISRYPVMKSRKSTSQQTAMHFQPCNPALNRKTTGLVLHFIIFLSNLVGYLAELGNMTRKLGKRNFDILAGNCPLRSKSLVALFTCGCFCATFFQY